MKQFASAVLLGTLCVQASVSAQSLKEVIQHTLNTNPDVEIVAKNRLAAEQELRQARAGYLPSVDISLG